MFESSHFLENVTRLESTVVPNVRFGPVFQRWLQVRCVVHTTENIVDFLLCFFHSVYAAHARNILGYQALIGVTFHIYGKLLHLLSRERRSA